MDNLGNELVRIFYFRRWYQNSINFFFEDRRFLRGGALLLNGDVLEGLELGVDKAELAAIRSFSPSWIGLR